MAVAFFFGAEGAAGRVAAEPDVWTDGSLVQDKVSGASSSGSGVLSSRGCSLIFLVKLVLIGGRGILMMMLVVTGPIGLAVVTVLFLVLYRLFREQSSGVSSLLFRLLIVFTLELII